MLNPRNKRLTRSEENPWLESGKDDARRPENGCIQVPQTHQKTDPHEREIPEPKTAGPADSKGERAGWTTKLER